VINLCTASMTIQTTKVVKKSKTKSTPKPSTTTAPKPHTPTSSNNSSNDSDDVPLTTQVLNSFDEAITVSDQLSSTVKELEAATQSQTSGIEEVSASIQSIATAIQGVASNATKAMDMMSKSEEITHQISGDAEKGMEKMDNMKTIVSESANDVKTLANELVKVDNMTGFITQIAEQTNLLALNAAIEAARAGDVGRGFAVVADEVRRLAENSKKGAEDISELISSLKDSSNKTTASIEKGNGLVEESYDMVTGILKSIENITKSITEVVSQMQEISAATEEVSSGTEEATAAGEEILSVSQTNLKSFEEIVIAKDQEAEVLKSAQSATVKLAELTDAFEQSVIVSSTDPDGNMNYFTKYFKAVSRFETEELMGQSHRILKSGWHDPGLFDALWKTISSGKTFKGYVRNRAKDGTIYWVKTSISPTYDENRKIKSYIGVRQVITELMVMSGIEQACQEDEAGKPLSNPKLKECIRKLKFGDYQITDNV
jgi:methyl-accepting chemotaxis protein